MNQPTPEFVTEQVEMNERLWARKDSVLEPQDLPGRVGRLVRALDRVLQTMGCESYLPATRPFGGTAITAA